MPITLTCPECGKTFTRPPSHAARVKTPFCSRQCNGAARGREWGKHGHKGRAAWSPEAEASAAEKMRGERNPAWVGGSYLEPDKGYRMVRKPGHPRARANGYVDHMSHWMTEHAEDVWAARDAAALTRRSEDSPQP